MCRAGICYLCYIDQNAWRPGQGGQGARGYGTCESAGEVQRPFYAFEICGARTFWDYFGLKTLS